jgi:hypothetical protein
MRRRQEPLLSLETILWLQTTSGNRAVQRLLARKAKQRELEQKRCAEATDQEGKNGSESTQAHWALWHWILRWFVSKWARLTQAARPTSPTGD